MQTIKTYSDLIKINNYKDRFNYLKIGGSIGEETFGYDRYLNQILYNSKLWKNLRRNVIVRDNGLDMGFPGYDILDRVLVHHINPITIDDVINENPLVYSMDNLITVSMNTHNAIHYGDESLLFLGVEVRSPNDTCPWKRG